MHATFESCFPHSLLRRAPAVYYSDLALRSMLKPSRFDRPIASPRPSRAKDVAFYASWEKRGYLSAEVRREREGGGGAPHARPCTLPTPSSSPHAGSAG